MSSGHFLRGETLVRGFPILRYGRVSAIVKFVLMPDGHHISCPNGGKKYGKETPFIGGLRSPLTIPESGHSEIPFRTVGNYPENDIAFFEIAPTSIVKRKEVSGKIHSLLRNRSPPKRFKSGGALRLHLIRLLHRKTMQNPPSPQGEGFQRWRRSAMTPHPSPLSQTPVGKQNKVFDPNFFQKVWLASTTCGGAFVRRSPNLATLPACFILAGEPFSTK